MHAKPRFSHVHNLSIMDGSPRINSVPDSPRQDMGRYRGSEFIRFVVYKMSNMVFKDEDKELCCFVKSNVASSGPASGQVIAQIGHRPLSPTSQFIESLEM